MKVRDNDNVD